MRRPFKPLTLSLVGALILVASAALILSSPAQAQCGSQASSCKNCHEVQAQDPVNTEGDWHVSHAFGDFCEFCHAGNVQAADADLAHQGMVAPLADPQASCSACHPSDALDLAMVYGAALGTEVGTGSAPTSAPNPPEAPTPTAPAASGVSSEPPQASLIDYNALYAQSSGERAPINVGNLILIVIIAAMALGGGGYVFWRERRRRASISPAAQVAPPATAAEPNALAARVEALDPLGRRALERLLRDPQTASDLLRRLSRLDPDVIRTVRGLDRETRALLLALTSD